MGSGGGSATPLASFARDGREKGRWEPRGRALGQRARCCPWRQSPASFGRGLSGARASNASRLPARWTRTPPPARSRTRCNIEDAVENAVQGADEVIIAPGTYTVPDPCSWSRTRSSTGRRDSRGRRSSRRNRSRWAGLRDGSHTGEPSRGQEHRRRHRDRPLGRDLGGHHREDKRGSRLQPRTCPPCATASVGRAATTWRRLQNNFTGQVTLRNVTAVAERKHRSNGIYVELDRRLATGPRSCWTPET